MPMNTVIQEKRRALGYTQEQVADWLGVSTPAVSKWETGTTCPDISLLSPLARLLKTDVNSLLCFHEKLSAQEIGSFCNEAAVSAQKDIVAAFSMVEAKLLEFPHDEKLCLNASILLDAALLKAELDGSEKAALDEKLMSWYSGLIQSSDSEISNSAKYMVVSRHIRLGKLDMAQAVLDTVQDRNEAIRALPDKLMLQVSIYMKQKRAELAALELERALYPAANRVQLLLSRLADAELLAGEKELAEQIAQRAQALTELLDMWEYTGYVAQYQIAADEKDAEKTAALLGRMLDSLSTPWNISASPLFYRIAPEMKKPDGKAVLAMLIKELETDPDYVHMRNTQAFAELIKKYKSE